MIIDKKKIIANWSNKSTHIDDIAYALYVKHCDKLFIVEGYELTVVDQDTFITLSNMNINGMDDWNNFYNQAKIIFREEKIDKIKSNDKRRIKK